MSSKVMRMKLKAFLVTPQKNRYDQTMNYECIHVHVLTFVLMGSNLFPRHVTPVVLFQRCSLLRYLHYRAAYQAGAVTTKPPR